MKQLDMKILMQASDKQMGQEYSFQNNLKDDDIIKIMLVVLDKKPEEFSKMKETLTKLTDLVLMCEDQYLKNENLRGVLKEVKEL